MDAVLLVLGIVIVVMLGIVIALLMKNNGREISFPSLDGMETRLESMQKDNRDSQAELRREVSASLKENMSFLSEQVMQGQSRTGDEQSRQIAAMANSQRQQLDIVGKSQVEQLSSMNRNISQKMDDMDRNMVNQLKQLEIRFAALEANTNTKLTDIRNDNAVQLEKVRQTVDEKMQSNLDTMSGSIANQMKALESRFATLEGNTNAKLTDIRNDNAVQLEKVRQTVDEKMQSNLDTMSRSIANQMKALESRFATLETNMENKLQNVRTTVDSQLKSIRDDNNRQLEQIRGTVDEKLQSTLEKKMNESFKLVSERLEQVYRGLGEMQNVAQGVGDLKKVLSNVKTRGILGEIQLGAILKEILTSDQYDENVATVPKSANRVEFAVKLPGAEDGKYIYLPIDSKFPGDRFAHLQDAYETGDKSLISSAKKEMIDIVKKCAKDISEKYIEPPYTTQFAIMFLPFEGLYAEVVNTPGLVEELQRTYKINTAGPSTMAAMLNSLKMGFQTLAIQKRSGEVWEVLGAVKTEFESFEKALSETQDRLRKTEDSLEKLVGVRTRQMNRKLSKIEKLDPAETYKILEND